MNRALSAAFGLLMVAAAAVDADDAALVTAALAVLAVLAGIVFRPAATLAVVLTAAALALDDTSAMLAATSGVCAVGYLVLRYTTAVPAPTMIGAVAFTCAALAAVSIPWQLPWVPLLAPLVVLSIVVVATRPFWADRLPTTS
ncbi:hypothetical protein [Mycolicibacterium sp. XJ1819]